MVSLSMLWLPILVSAIAIWFAGYIFWMVLPHHKSDWTALPDEEGVRGTFKKVPPGQYYFPFVASPAEMKSEEWQGKMKEGPVGRVLIEPAGQFAMGGRMVQYFIYTAVISTFVAYLTGHTLPAGADYMQVFRVAGTAATLAYAGALMPYAIWMGRTTSSIVKEIFDGVVFGLITAGIFGWLWPA